MLPIIMFLLGKNNGHGEMEISVLHGIVISQMKMVLILN